MKTRPPKSKERKTEQGIYCGEHRRTCCVECGACPADPQQHHSYCSQCKRATKHTPGPWNSSTNKILVTAPSNGAAGSIRICTLNSNETLFSKEERESNARLISAAPDLLEAIKRLESATDNLFKLIPRGVDKLPEVQDALGAIATARIAISKTEAP